MQPIKNGFFMVHLTKIYTKTGDKGETSLASGNRVPKDSPEIRLLGAIDEVNSVLGLFPEYGNSIISRIQNDLFDIGAEIAGSNKFKLSQDRIDWLEMMIDGYLVTQEPLHSFVLPTGGLHFARTIVRRAERELWWSESYMEINKFIPQYLNRLSDLLFVMARDYNRGSEKLWKPMDNSQS